MMTLIFNAYKTVSDDGVIHKQAFGVSDEKFRIMRRKMIDSGFEQVSRVHKNGNHKWCLMKFVGRKSNAVHSDNERRE